MAKKYLSNTKVQLTIFEINLVKNTQFEMYFCIYITLPQAANNWKSLNYEISIEKEKIGPTKYPKEKVSDPGNIYESTMTQWR